MSGVRTLVVWCPDWPLVAAGLCDRPSAVLGAGRVVACSAPARVEGVARGLRRRQAEASCPGLAVVDHDPAADARAFEPVVAAVEVFTPGVEIVRPGVCALATRGPSRYFGGDGALAARVAAAVDGVLARFGDAPACRVGLADGPFAAERAARQGLVVPAGASAAFLAGFPVSTLGAELADLLVRLGIRTLGQLAELPAPAVLARFGPQGATAHRLARGLDERPLAARIPPPELAETAELDPPAERLETAAFVAKGLADRLHDHLAEEGLTATLVLVEAEWEDGRRLGRRWRLDGNGGRTAAALAERVRWQVDGWLSAPLADRPSGGLTLLRLVPEEVRSDDGRQLGFWGGDRGAAERVARALARVQGMLGPDAVVTAVPDGGRSPAEQVRLVPWGETVGSAARGVRADGSAPPWPGRIPPPAPATVHPVPVPAEVADARLSVAGSPWSPVAAWAGPWPVDERWWDHTAHRRRARWQVVTADGVAHLLSQQGDRWEVEATYD
ncbi:MAG TPA: DNA polymerase Y family protein [Acidimicrobiales bacterium]|nr:DNA polymerase Y family protein [Acidimicrobiales bacterium]